MVESLIHKLLKVIVKPETTNERLAHEVLEFVVYGNIYKYLAEQLEE